MKFFIAGHSDSGSAYLSPGASPWTERIRDWLTAGTAETCELQGVRFAPMGPKAVPYLLHAVGEASPDILILPIGGYVCTVGTVAESVRKRFGERAGRLFRRSEAAFQSRTSSGLIRRRVNAAGRTASRRILGTRTLATVEETSVIYIEILHGLAQVESLQVVVVRDARFSDATQRREPRLQARFDELEAAVLPVAEQHHFLVADLEGALRQAPDRRVFHQDDGVHTTGAFHEVYFEVLRTALAEITPLRV